MSASTQTHGVKFVSAVLNPRDQTPESLHALVNYMLGLAGCRTCGRGTVLRVDFGGDPPDELNGVVSITQQGLGDS